METIALILNLKFIHFLLIQFKKKIYPQLRNISLYPLKTVVLFKTLSAQVNNCQPIFSTYKIEISYHLTFVCLFVCL